MSHAEPDSELAKYLQATLEETQGITVFVASRPGHIPLGKKWFDHVMDELQGASAYVVLLTPSSKARPWVAFETGAAFLTGRPCAPVCVGVKPGEIGGPYVGLQLIPLDSAETVRVVFEQLGARPPRNAAAFLRRVDDLVREGLDAVAAAEGWQYVTIDGRDYAWEGPLEALEDREPEFVNYEVFDPLIRPQLEAARLEVRWRRIEGYAREGAKRVFLTDRRTYRRPIVDHDVCLTVKTSPDDRTA